MVNYAELERERQANERKQLIDMETDVKSSVSHLKDALQYVSEIGVNDETWALAHHLYAAVEECDKALGIIYSKERLAGDGYTPDYPWGAHVTTKRGMPL